MLRRGLRSGPVHTKIPSAPRTPDRYRGSVAMRRRDANDSHWLSGQVTAGGRTAIALACSAAVHAALLFLAAGVALRTHQEAPLIRLSLLVPGGGNGAEVSPS